MGKLLVILACVLGTAIAGRIPLESNGGIGMSWWELQRQNVRPTLMDLVTLRWRLNPRIGLQLQSMRQNDMESNRQQNRIGSIWEGQEPMRTVTEERNNRVPVVQQVLEGIERNLPTTDANSDRLLHLGRRRQQQLSQPTEDREERRQGLLGVNDWDETVRLGSMRQEEDRTVPIRINRIGDDLRSGEMREEDILQLIRRDNRLTEMSDNEIIEMLRLQRQEKMERRRNEQAEEESRMEELQRRQQSEEQRLMGRRMSEEEDIVDRGVGNLKSLRRDDERLVHINRRRLEQNTDEMTPIRINRIGEGRRVDPMPLEDILPLIRRDNRLTEMSDNEIIEMLRRQRQEKMERRLKQQAEERNDNVIGVDRAQDDMTPLRINRIAEGRRVAPMPEEEIMKLIRKDNRLTDMSDVEIIEMLRRQRQEKLGRSSIEMNQAIEGSRLEQTEQNRLMGRRMGQEDEVVNSGVDNLKSRRRDDERLVHINRRRLEQNTDEMTPIRISRIGEGRRVAPMPLENILPFIRRDNRLTDMSDNEIMEMLRRQRQEKMERRLKQQTEERNEDVLGENRRDQTLDEVVTPLRINRIGEGRRVGPMPEEEILKYIRRDNHLMDMSDDEVIEMLRRQRQEKLERRRMEQDEKLRGEDVQMDRRDQIEEKLLQRRINRNEDGNRLEEQNEQDRIMGRRVNNEETVVDRGLENLKSLRRDDERLVHINRRRLATTQEQMQPLRINRIEEDRRLMDDDRDILQYIRSDDPLMNLTDETIMQMLRQNRQRMEDNRMDRAEKRRAVEDVQGGELPSVPRDDDRLVHINRRRLVQEMTPRNRVV